MAAPVSKAEYLKKYLSGPKTEEKTVKKKKLRPVLKSKSKGSGMRIIDEDVDLDQIRRGSDDDEQILGTREEAPQVFAVVDERPLELRVKEDYATNPKWKRVATTDASDESRLKNKNVLGKTKHLSRSRHDSGSDISPPRPSRKRHDSGSDLSPPRPSPKRHDSGSDLSPPRPSRKRHDSGSDLSPPRPSRKRHDSGSDLSPPRPSHMRHDSDASPPRRQQSPSSDLSPPRAKKQAGKSYELDQNPRRKCVDSDEDQSPPRRRRDSDPSPPRKRVDPDGDQSPPRKQRDSDSDHSPLRRKQPSPDLSPKRKTKNDDAGDGKVESSSKMSKTLEGKKAGLQSARLLREETEEFRKRENEAFKHLSKEITGAGATTNVRAGKRRELELKAEKEREKEEKRKELEKIFSKWNKGVKQLEERKQRVEDDVYEMSKPLARYEGDEDLEKMLRDQDREGDPMAKYMAKKKAKSQNEPNKPRYQGPPPPPNRFGIMPGFRWDGVDRSNGFEKKLFERKNSSKALEEEAYKWSVSDM